MFQFERSELPEDIFSTLHEDMTPEERFVKICGTVCEAAREKSTSTYIGPNHSSNKRCISSFITRASNATKKYVFLLIRKIAEEEKKLERWRIWQHKLDNLVDRLSRRLDRVKSGEKPKDRKALHERKDEAQVIT